MSWFAQLAEGVDFEFWYASRGADLGRGAASWLAQLAEDVDFEVWYAS